MSLASVRAFLAARAPDIAIIETDDRSATVDEAARAHGVEPRQIAKTLSLRVGDRTFLLVAPGHARLDNRKAKAAFGGKVSMLSADEVVAATGHPVGGVCPFGLATDLPVYFDETLKAFDVVYPAGGSRNTSVRVATNRLFELVGKKWVDLCRLPEEPAGA